MGAVRKVGAFEAKTKFSELLDRVERGEEIIITRHGKPVARIVPHERRRNEEEIRKAIEDIRRLRREVSLGGLDWRELRDEGRE